MPSCANEPARLWCTHLGKQRRVSRRDSLIVEPRVIAPCISPIATLAAVAVVCLAVAAAVSARAAVASCGWLLQEDAPLEHLDQRLAQRVVVVHETLKPAHGVQSAELAAHGCMLQGQMWASWGVSNVRTASIV